MGDTADSEESRVSGFPLKKIKIPTTIVNLATNTYVNRAVYVPKDE